MRFGITVFPMATLSFKVTTEEARLIRRHAQREKATISAYLRKRALGPDPQGQPAAVLRPHAVSGLTVDAGAGPSVSQDEIDAALADFP